MRTQHNLGVEVVSEVVNELGLDGGLVRQHAQVVAELRMLRDDDPCVPRPTRVSTALAMSRQGEHSASSSAGSPRPVSSYCGRPARPKICCTSSIPACRRKGL